MGGTVMEIRKDLTGTKKDGNRLKEQKEGLIEEETKREEVV